MPFDVIRDEMAADGLPGSPGITGTTLPSIISTTIPSMPATTTTRKLLLRIFVEDLSAVCLPGWVFFAGSGFCYFLGANFGLTVTESRQYCIDQGGDLASIHSDAENTFVTCA